MQHVLLRKIKISLVHKVVQTFGCNVLKQNEYQSLQGCPCMGHFQILISHLDIQVPLNLVRLDMSFLFIMVYNYVRYLSFV